MSNHLDTLDALNAWATGAQQAGWLDNQRREAIAAHRPHDPTQLFASGETAPLVLAFFGGTGVGKSSLLNRLAGSDVAKSGVVRPTSREVTLYLHEDVELASLPAELPVEHTRIQRHAVDAHRDALWIDTPDIDSVVTTHRDQVMAWMPYIDLLVYVVSPERYRDDAGWDLLQQHRKRHDWAFVINHWDRGDPAQREDFIALLRAGGIDDPAVFCTDCRDGGSPTDDFERLQAHVAASSEALAIAEARQRGAATERAALTALIESATDALGHDTAWSEIDATIESQLTGLAQHLESDTHSSRAAVHSRLFPAPEPPFWRRVLGAREHPKAPPVDIEVWTARGDDRLIGALDNLLIAANDAALPTTPLRQVLTLKSLHPDATVNGACSDALHAALETPGTALQRGVHRMARLLAIALPLMVLLWVGQRVLQGFLAGASDPTQYIGLNFLTNSLMLLVLSALLPAALAEWLRPSQRAACATALREGLRQGCITLTATARHELSVLKGSRDKLLSSLRAIATRLD